MNQQNSDSINTQNEINTSSNINCMSIIKTYIDYSSLNSKINKKIYDLDKSYAGILEIENFKNVETSLEKIQCIYFDKTIFALLKRQKMPERDCHYLFYIFFIQEIYRSYTFQLGHKKFSKFFKKYFNASMKSKMLKEQEIVAYSNFYLIQLFQLITGSKNETEISVLKKMPIIDFKNLDNINIKYMKLLIKYILAFTNILDSKKEYKDFHTFIFDTFLNVENPIFQNYYMKQLNKIFLKKGIYSFSNNFIIYILYPFIYKNNKKSVYEFSLFSSRFINCILHYQPKYLINKNNDLSLYKHSSPFYFLNMSILINILRDMITNDDVMQNIIFKFIDSFNNKINLFIDDDNKLRIAEFLLIDTINDRIIRNHLDIIEIIKPYFRNEENNKNNFFFDTLFYDLCLEKYITFYFSNSNKKNKENRNMNDSNLNQSYSQSQDLEDYFFNEKNVSKNKSKKDYIDLIINKYNTSNHFILNKYFLKLNDTTNNINIDDYLSNKNMEELFILLDLVYIISIKTDDINVIKECILDIKKIIICIIKKSFSEKKFNCIIFDFITKIDKKYIPLPSEFDILSSNEILIKTSFVNFIKTYPLFLIFILNYFPKNNLPILQFFKILKSFMIGYYKNVFNQVDGNMNDYNHTLQINYLNIIYFIIGQILNIYQTITKNNDYIDDFNKEVMRYLSYCLNCQKKIKNPFIISNYLIECTYCGEKYLFINTNLFDYLKNEIEEIKKFIDECVYNVITGLTCIILSKFIEKYEKRDVNPMFCYSLYYKIMNEHFNFLNYIKLKIGKNIPYVIEPNSEINNKEGALDEYINFFFDKYITEKSKYPFRTIYDTIENDDFVSFNSFRKTIKHECQLANCKNFKL